MRDRESGATIALLLTGRRKANHLERRRVRPAEERKVAQRYISRSARSTWRRRGAGR